jgi:hypothetical protein
VISIAPAADWLLEQALSFDTAAEHLEDRTLEKLVARSCSSAPGNRPKYRACSAYRFAGLAEDVGVGGGAPPANKK